MMPCDPHTRGNRTPKAITIAHLDLSGNFALHTPPRAVHLQKYAAHQGQQHSSNLIYPMISKNVTKHKLIGSSDGSGRGGGTGFHRYVVAARPHGEHLCASTWQFCRGARVFAGAASYSYRAGYNGQARQLPFDLESFKSMPHSATLRSLRGTPNRCHSLCTLCMQ